MARDEVPGGKGDQERDGHREPVGADQELGGTGDDQAQAHPPGLPTSQALTCSAAPSSAFSARSTDIATHVNVGVSRLV